MKIFAVIPTRNDAWILPTVLSTVSLWADQIIVADENSWDSTEDVCKRFPKVQFLKFEPKEFNESNRRQVLLDAVRQWDGENLIFALDSDEIITAEILKTSEINKLVNLMKPGMSAKLQWIMLWKNARQYRNDNLPEWSANFKQFVYWDNRKVKFENVKMHSSRVPESLMENVVTFSGFRVLHYAFADWERMLAKQAYYLALEKTMGSTQHPYLLNRKYRWFYNQPASGIVVKDLPGAWIDPFNKQGIDLSMNFPKEDLYWYEAEVLRFFQKYGLENFKHLNLWYTEWEAKRQLAKQSGERGIFDQVINNPQPWYDRVYYRYFQGLVDQGGFFDKIKLFL